MVFVFRDGDRLEFTWQFWPDEEHLPRHPEHVATVELPPQVRVQLLGVRQAGRGLADEPECGGLVQVAVPADVGPG